MKSFLKYIIVPFVLFFSVTSCFKEPDVQGYIGEGIRLQGSDTMYVAIGAKVASSSAWLDNSTRPCKFKIENVRDEAGNRVDGFFQGFPTRLWAAPYDYLTDKTLDQVMAKLTDATLTPLMINETNGQLRAMESTANIGLKEGDIYHVDVSVSNSKGSVFLKDYAILKIEKGTGGESAVDFELTDMVNGICIVGKDDKGAPSNTFPYYDQINAAATNFSTRRDNIYKDNGKEKTMAIRKLSSEPSVGIRVYIKMYDKNGKLFNPEEYATYSTTTSYIDYSVNRKNLPQVGANYNSAKPNKAEEGLYLEFPYTPWPVGLTYSYIRGSIYKDFSNLDWEKLKADNIAGTIPKNANWPEDDYDKGKNGWYVRVRTNVKFYQPGTYELVFVVPYTTAK